ncbi:MAG: hypothetical protein HY329_04500 [Chloroflexi bacterium]|nr:hypothetical protein [Chloroflexota bacterium]
MAQRTSALERQSKKPRWSGIPTLLIEALDETLEACSIVLGRRGYLLTAIGATVVFAGLFTLTGRLVRYSPVYERWVFSAPFLDTLLLVAVPPLMGVIVALQAHNLRACGGRLRESRNGLLSSIGGFVLSKWCCLLPFGLSVAGASTSFVELSGWAIMLRPVSLVVLTIALWLTARSTRSPDCPHCHT